MLTVVYGVRLLLTFILFRSELELPVLFGKKVVTDQFIFQIFFLLYDEAVTFHVDLMKSLFKPHYVEIGDMV